MPDELKDPDVEPKEGSTDDPSQDKKSTSGRPSSLSKKVDADDDVDTSSDDDKLSAEELKEQADALDIYKLLKGPKGEDTVRNLARQFSIELAGKDKPAKKDASSTAEIIKEALGSEYAFMADKLGKAIEQVIEEKVMPQVATANATSHNNTVQSTVNELLEEEGIPKALRTDLIASMDTISEQLPMPKKGNMKLYMKRLFNLALEEDTKISGRLKKAKANDEESDDVSSSPMDLISGYKVRKGPDKRTLTEAVAAAGRGEIWEE